MSIYAYASTNSNTRSTGGSQTIFSYTLLIVDTIEQGQKLSLLPRILVDPNLFDILFCEAKYYSIQVQFKLIGLRQYFFHNSTPHQGLPQPKGRDMLPHVKICMGSPECPLMLMKGSVVLMTAHWW